MKKFVSVLAIVMMTSPALAGDVEAECLAASAEWGSTGDVATQCSCIADSAAGDAALAAEFMGFRSLYTNDAEAYEGASDGAKSVMDSCAVES